MALIVGLILAGICGVCIAGSFLLWCLKKRKDKLAQDARDAALYEAVTGIRPKYKAQVQLKLKQMKREWPGQEEARMERQKKRGFTAKGEVDPWSFAHWKARQTPQGSEAVCPKDFV